MGTSRGTAQLLPSTEDVSDLLLLCNLHLGFITSLREILDETPWLQDRFSLQLLKRVVWEAGGWELRNKN